MKYGQSSLTSGSPASLPSRERGLKSVIFPVLPSWTFVAPLAGAWIEIRWTGYRTQSIRSLPSRERGLKLLVFLPLTLLCKSKSLPSRERGLKFFRIIIVYYCFPSLPSRGRGLKLFFICGRLYTWSRSPRGGVD